MVCVPAERKGKERVKNGSRSASRSSDWLEVEVEAVDVMVEGGVWWIVVVV